MGHSIYGIKPEPKWKMENTLIESIEWKNGRKTFNQMIEMYTVHRTYIHDILAKCTSKLMADTFDQKNKNQIAKEGINIAESVVDIIDITKYHNRK